MTYEEAYYFEILLSLGITDGYDEWLSYYLEKENPVSDIVLELSFNITDISKSISILHNFRCDRTREINENVLCEKLRFYLKEKVQSKALNEKQVVNLMYQMACIIGDPGSFDYKIWNSFYYMSDYFSLAESGAISIDSFNKAFLDYLLNGKELV